MPVFSSPDSISFLFLILFIDCFSLSHLWDHTFEAGLSSGLFHVPILCVYMDTRAQTANYTRPQLKSLITYMHINNQRAAGKSWERPPVAAACWSQLLTFTLLCNVFRFLPWSTQTMFLMPGVLELVMILEAGLPRDKTPGKAQLTREKVYWLTVAEVLVSGWLASAICGSVEARHHIERV